MSYGGIADDNQLQELTEFLDRHCRGLGIAEGDPAREALGKQIMALWSAGFQSVEAIRQSLAPNSDVEVIATSA